MRMENTHSRRSFVKAVSLFTVSTLVLPWKGCIRTGAPVRFGLATDSHYADRGPAGTRFYRSVLDKMSEFTEVMNEEAVDFVVHLGDFKDEAPDKKEADTLRFLNTIEQTYAQYSGPRYHCVGNHDVDSIRKAQFLTTIENTGMPKDRSYYSFDAKGYHFIVLDANFESDGNDHFYAEGADWEDTNITSEQLEWLRDDLEENAKPTVIFCHHPLFEYVREGNKYHVNNYQEVQQIFTQHGHVLAVFQGHVHEEKIRTINGVHYVTQLGMVDFDGLENNSFALIEIVDDKITINGYKRTSSHQLK